MVTATKSTKSTPVKAKATIKPKVVKFTPPEVTEGTWQESIVQSGVLKARAAKGDAKAGEMLWSGAQEGINAWLPTSDEDASAEGLNAEIIALLGKSRKGDASKIAKVAVGVKDHGLILSSWKNLSQAYGEAKRLIDAIPAQTQEDHAAEELTASIAESAPKSASSIEGAAKIVLASGVDEASRVLVAAVIDAAGSYDKAEPVLRALLRSLSQEVVGVKPKAEPKAKAPAKPKGDAVKVATAKPASEKAKAAPKAKAKAKPKPVAEVEDEDIEVTDEGVEDTEEGFDFDDSAVEAGLNSDLDDLLDDETDEETEVSTPDVPVKAKAKPVVRRR